MTSGAGVLKKIYAAKQALLDVERSREPYEELRVRALTRAGERRRLQAALRAAAGTAVVAEIKRASPSAGPIAPAFDLLAIARSYEAAGAAAISVVTERDYFAGDLAYLDLVRAVTTRPILRKDFLWTRYHVAQSAAHGADGVLLVVAGMSDGALLDCMDEARHYGLDALVEVHDDAELERALAAGADLIGINNRNLRTFVTDLGVGERLLPKVPAHVFAVSESGIRNRSDVTRLLAAGAQGFLIGEAPMRAANPKALIESLRCAVSG